MTTKQHNQWFVYILLCADDTYYTGITNNIKKRLAQHKAGTGAKYTQAHGAKEIVHVEEFPDRQSASIREYKIKQLSRVEKKSLIKKKLF